LFYKECDVAGAILTTLSRAELVDFSHPVVYNPGYYLIPASTPISFNISITVLPFQPLVILLTGAGIAWGIGHQ